ncbi:MAG: branched-chain amino acid ABC transporter substrate-binding protein [Betaproteobacteria bacterium]
MLFRIVAFVLLLQSFYAFPAAETVRIAHIDPLSGPFANVGQSLGRHLQAAVDEINANGGLFNGARIELVNLDDKSSPQESILDLQQAIDRGIRYITQANGSNIAHALSEAVTKFNARNPDRAILYLNLGAIDPTLTNENCSFWHFRFDADVDMKMEALTNYMKLQKGIHKVYLINQDYAQGQAVSRAARALLKSKRPDIEIVGDDLHPIGKVKDFSPYVAKIKASGADTILTGSWGSDLSLLIRAGKEAGLATDYYALYAYIPGSPTAIGESGVNRVKTLSAWQLNLPANKLEKFATEYKSRYGEDMWFNNAKTELDMLVNAMKIAQSTEPLRVAMALEGMKWQGDTGELWMRADDHQLMQPLFVSTFARVGKGVKYDVENLGLGWRGDVRIEGKDTALPTTCRMARPVQ